MMIPLSRKYLEAVIAYMPAKELSANEQCLVWMFRYYLSREARALVKFVRAAEWSDPRDKEEALNLLQVWARPAQGDLLQLLTKSMQESEVREEAGMKGGREEGGRW